MDVTLISDELTPCTVRETIIISTFGDIAHKRELAANRNAPALKNFARPKISDSLPKGRSVTAVASRNDVDIQLSEIADTLNSLPIVGSAIFIAELIKPELKDAKVVIIIISIL
jgi:hypothetical protein